MHPEINYDTTSGGGRSLPHDSTIDVLVPIGITLNFIDSWLQLLKKNYPQQATIYSEKMSDFSRIFL